MPVRCCFYDIIIPIANIERSYPGGFPALKSDFANLIGGRVWYDDYLLRDGAMSADDAYRAIEGWESFGLQASEGTGPSFRWKDLCMFSVFGGGPIRCDWLHFDRRRQCVYLKGTPSEPVIGRLEMNAVGIIPKHQERE